ncbi:hypothetical protein CES86_5253 [Brucella lupini]|uniref:Uncharacterized protein n=1 Tax=Brucella lupini TaxID=255457 RepID=A0A256G9R4_9HYPH|nr:hypothetical protein CES86_5253 [Brucella lupini]
MRETVASGFSTLLLRRQAQFQKSANVLEIAILGIMEMQQYHSILMQ